MKSTCQEIPIEKLVAYSDGELPPDEAKQVEEHINNCRNCQTILKALQDSLKVAQEIWQSDEAKWGDLRSFKKPNLSRWPIKQLAAVAASILLICGVGLMWLMSETSEQTHVVGKAPTIEEIKIEADRAAIAAQMLAVGDMYAAQPSGEKYAVQQYNDLIESFSGMKESEQAKLRLQVLLERANQ